MDVVATLGVGELLASIALIGFGLMVRRRDPRVRLCPGRTTGRLHRVFPPMWFMIRACRYDLSGSVPDREGAITCPECGLRMAHGHRILTSPRRWRPLALGITLGAVALSMLLLARSHVTSTIKLVPTPLLLMTETVLGNSTPQAARREWRTRVATQQLSAWQQPNAASLLVRNLRDDGITWNAQTSMDLLESLGDAAIPALEEALSASDWQQRQLAGSLLRRMPMYAPSESLLAVTVEGLRNDDLPRGRRGAFTYVWNARAGVHYLALNARDAEPFLQQGMQSDDMQQRFLCAVAAGFGGRVALIDDAMPILIEHLADNQIGGDATWSMRAIAGFGVDSVPRLEPFIESDDAQQDKAVRYLILRLRDGVPAGSGKLPRLNVTRVTGDPVTVDWEHLDFPEF